MRILELVFTLFPGGAERFALDLTNELAKTNDVTMVTIKDELQEPDKAQFYKNELSDRVRYMNLGLPDGFSLGSVWSIYKAIKSVKADVVHIHGENMPFFCILAIILLNNKTKFYQTIHSDINPNYSTLLYKFLFKTIGYSHRMGFVALSPTNYKELMNLYPKIKGTCIINGRAKVLPSPFIKEVIQEIEGYKYDPSSRLYLHVARCNPLKNQMLLVKAFNSFIEHGYNADLIVIGPGFDKELGRSIKKEACLRVHFLDTRKNVGDYMLNADVFCLSSDYEGMPITILEAGLCGVPIVSTPVCGAIDVVQDGKNGVLSKGHSLDDYIIALERSYTEFDELKKQSMAMKENSQLTIENCAKKYIEFFNS